MSDFLIQFGCSLSERAVTDALRDREGMHDLRVAQFNFAWGSAVVQETRSFGYDPVCLNGHTYFAVGRPRVIGVTHEQEGPQGFTRRWAAAAETATIDDYYRDLTGLFALVGCGPEHVVLLTGRLGYYAVYLGRDRHGRTCAIGSIPDLVAQTVGRSGDIDLVSCGEFLVRHTPTFPYTIYRGVLELAPGTLHKFTVCENTQIKHGWRAIWTPVEPQTYPTLRQLRDQLTCAVSAAGRELTRGAKRVAVTLSGGIDSRTVLAVVPRHKRAAALTFVDRRNHEFSVAQRVAATYGVPHTAVIRDPELYASLPEREISLLGASRTAMHAHGYALVDDGVASRYDLVLSGLSCDVLLKAWFAPETVRAVLAARLGVPRSLRARWHRPRYDWADPNLPSSMWAIRPEIQREMRNRRVVRLRELSAIRPETASEWIGAYPFSRVRSASYSMCNMRLFPSDELYVYRDVLEVARTCPLLPKLMQRLTNPVFAALCGPAASIETTKTGLPANLSWLQTRLRLRLRRLRGRTTSATAQAPAAAPWFTDHSWVDLRKMQQHSPVWAQLRARAARAPGLDILASVLQVDPRGLFAGYDERLSSQFQVAAVQLGLSLGESVSPLLSTVMGAAGA